MIRYRRLLFAGLLDTSVFITRGAEGPLGELLDRLTVSVITIGELQFGVLSVVDAAFRARPGDTGDARQKGTG